MFRPGHVHIDDALSLAVYVEILAVVKCGTCPIDLNVITMQSNAVTEALIHNGDVKLDPVVNVFAVVYSHHNKEFAFMYLD